MDMEDKLKYGYDYNAEKMSFEDFAYKWLESVTLSLFCGFRKGETLALHWNDIDFKEKKISISKSVGMTENGFDYKEPNKR